MLKSGPESTPASPVDVSPKHRNREEAGGEAMVLMVGLALSFIPGESSSRGKGAGISSFELLRNEIR